MAHLHEPPRAILYTRQRITRGPTGAPYVTLPGAQELRSAWATRATLRTPLSRALFYAFARRTSHTWYDLACNTLGLSYQNLRGWLHNPHSAPAFVLRRILGAEPTLSRWLDEERAIRHMEIDTYFAKAQRELANGAAYAAATLQARAERAMERNTGRAWITQRKYRKR